jgi:predicted branched-subunit amino acid permease
MQKENDEIFGVTEAKSSSRKTKNDLLMFFIGLILLGAGLFWLFQRTSVATVGIFSGGLLFGNIMIPTGVVLIPLILGIILLFFLEDKRIIGWIVTVIGLIIVILSILMSVRISFERTSLFEFICMFGFIAAGTGLLLRTLFRKRD